MNRILLAGIVAVATALTLAQTANAEPMAPPVPGEIVAPEGHKPFLIGHATGVQIYACRSTAAGYEWGLVAPRANVYDDKGKLLMTHAGGPSWVAQDGSKVIARRDKFVNVDRTAVDWLLLAATSATAGPDGDRLAGTTYIQRIKTVGGIAPPAGECTADTAGTQNEVSYTADYVFWKRTGS